MVILLKFTQSQGHQNCLGDIHVPHVHLYQVALLPIETGLSNGRAPKLIPSYCTKLSKDMFYVYEIYASNVHVSRSYARPVYYFGPILSIYISCCK